MFNNLKVSGNNSLKENIEELLEWLDQMDEGVELGRTYFKEGISEKELTDWEEKNGVQIPESYKEWLRFSKESRIDGTVASFFGPDKFHSDFVPKDLIVIGDIVGDGELICFSRKSGEFVEYFERNISETYDDFSVLIKETLMLLGKRENRKREITLAQSYYLKKFDDKQRENITTFYEKYGAYTIEKMTRQFNSINIEDRKAFLGLLYKKEKVDFIKCLRSQAVKDFWTHERELIRKGECTRQWTLEQIEAIYNISEKNGMSGVNGGSAFDRSGKIYYGRHMFSVMAYPEYAGDWRNIQALDYNELYNGAWRV